jgi:hypothetical protein
VIGNSRVLAARQRSAPNRRDCFREMVRVEPGTGEEAGKVRLRGKAAPRAGVDCGVEEHDDADSSM